jgi:hypothetical protein
LSKAILNLKTDLLTPSKHSSAVLTFEVVKEIIKKVGSIIFKNLNKLI